jgi:cytochrome P450 family 97 subfamily B polypeptide 3
MHAVCNANAIQDIKQMQFVRLIVAESLRMYPEPPLLIRRALEDDVLPKGSGTFQPKIPRVSFFLLHIA